MNQMPERDLMEELEDELRAVEVDALARAVAEKFTEELRTGIATLVGEVLRRERILRSHTMIR